jgi:hypothetical protein
MHQQRTVKDDYLPTEALTTSKHGNHNRLREYAPSTGLGTDLSDPALHYGVIVDCGSSGSRVYIYHWPPHTGQINQLLNLQPVRDADGKPYIKKIEPGKNTQKTP